MPNLLTINQTGWVQFRHALIRDAAYGGLPFRTRQRLHAQVGDSICANAGDQADSQAELLSLHYFWAQHWQEAWHFSRVAGHRAKEIYANAEAATFYVRALDAARRIEVSSSERAEVLKSLAQVQYEAGSFDAARSALRGAIRLVSEDLTSRADLHLQLARVAQKLGAFSSALRETAIGLRLVEAVEGPEAVRARARLRAFRAGILSDQFRPREALRVGLPAAEEAQASGELEALARVYSYIDEAYQTLGQRDMAIHEPKALEIFETLGNLPGIALLTNNLGVQAYSDGRWDDAISFYIRGQDASRRSGNGAMEGVAATNLGEVLISRGRLADAEVVLTEARRVLRAHKYVRFALFAETQLGRLLLERGDLSEAITALTGVVQEATSQNQTLIAVDAAVHLAEAYVRNGDPEAALDVVAEAQRLAGDDAALFEIPLGRVQARALLTLGRQQEAAAHAATALHGSRQQGLVFEQALLLLIQAELASPEDSLSRQSSLEEAERLLEGLGVTDRYLARNPSTSV
jgi:tetratricopeptide (TPR) repeat protein